VGFLPKLVDLGFEVISTEEPCAPGPGRGSGAPGFRCHGPSEILDGRVKTLHPIFSAHPGPAQRGGDMETIQGLGWEPIDLVAVNLYPFAKRPATPSFGEEIIEQIDIGGPSLIRAAAKTITMFTSWWIRRIMPPSGGGRLFARGGLPDSGGAWRQGFRAHVPIRPLDPCFT